MPIAVSAVSMGLSAVKTSFDLIKGLRDTLGKPGVNPTEVQARLLEIESLLLDARRNLLDAEEENRSITVHVIELERYADIGTQFTDDGGLYWYKDYPYCPNCWQLDRKPVRLDGPHGFTNSDWSCPLHHSKYYHQKYYKSPHV